jgi:hypothetical protein
VLTYSLYGNFLFSLPIKLLTRLSPLTLLCVSFDPLLTLYLSFLPGRELAVPSHKTFSIYNRLPSPPSSSSSLSDPLSTSTPSSIIVEGREQQEREKESSNCSANSTDAYSSIMKEAQTRSDLVATDEVKAEGKYSGYGADENFSTSSSSSDVSGRDENSLRMDAIMGHTEVTVLFKAPDSDFHGSCY